MAIDKHTQAFAKQMEEASEYNIKLDFVRQLSTKQHNNVCSALLIQKGTNKITTRDIYNYCINMKIRPEGNSEHLRIKEELEKQQRIDFDATPTEPTDYSTFEVNDDIKVKGKDGFVIFNDKENKSILIEYFDGEEETIKY